MKNKEYMYRKKCTFLYCTGLTTLFSLLKKKLQAKICLEMLSKYLITQKAGDWTLTYLGTNVYKETQNMQSPHICFKVLFMSTSLYPVRKKHDLLLVLVTMPNFYSSFSSSGCIDRWKKKQNKQTNKKKWDTEREPLAASHSAGQWMMMGTPRNPNLVLPG